VFPGITSANADENPELRGAMVYNDGQNPAVPAGIYIWNGSCWTKDGGDITVATPSITANGLTDTDVTFIPGQVTFAVVSPQADVTYQWFSSTSLSPSDGTQEDTGNSYTTLALTEDTYYYFCKATSASCPSFYELSSMITVKVIPNPLSLPVGDGEFSGTNCFDVVQINDNAVCGLITNRLSRQHSFSAKPTETYTFTGSATDLMFASKNLDAAHPVIQSISQNENEVTVTFYPGLDEAAAGLTRADALKAELYAMFMDGGDWKHLTVTLSVSDCLCCPGLFIPGGEYEDIAMTETLPPGSTSSNTNGSAADSLLSSTDANGFGNKKTGNGLCYYYRSANSSGTPGGLTYYGWHQNVCQMTDGIDAADAHADWRLPNLGELAQIGQLVSNSAEGAIKAGVGSQAEINKAINKGTGYNPFGSLPTGTVTANGTYNMTKGGHWSSTQATSANAWYWAYSIGARYALNNKKTYGCAVRCVRKF
jgi:uncharacterized protein (TIGR02145 family)